MFMWVLHIYNKSERVEGKEPPEQPRLQRNALYKHASVFSGEDRYNYWKIAETIDNPENKEMDMDALNLEVLYIIA